jgi:CelD/BcsL family acetyltransferase involved in cellulose biosynthesis
LYVRDAPCAFWIGTLYKNTFYLNFTGYDPDYRNYEPGTILFIKMLEDLISQNLKHLDFGFGDAFYKQSFCDQNLQEASVYIFAPIFKGIGINSARLLVTLVSNWAQLILRKTNLLGRIKRIWRDRLSQKKGDNGNS